MLPNILKYNSIKKFIESLKEDILEYIGKDKVCIVGLGENGVFYGEGVYLWLKRQGYDVTFTTMDDYGQGLEEKKAKGRKILITDSHIITGHAYRNALETLRVKKDKLKIKDIKCAVMHDLRGFADFVAERYISPVVKLDKKDLEIIEIISKDGRTPYTEIAQKIKLTPVATKLRIERLLNQGILRLKGVVNLEKFYSVSANIGMGVDSLTCEKLIEKLKENPLVYNLKKVSGSNKNLIVDIVAPNLKVIEEFLDSEIRREKGIYFIEVNTGGLPILPKEISFEEFKLLAGQLELKNKNEKKTQH
jgi:Lrp/AsnC family transcriptional regulator for asnA, asnC and gidA